MKSQLTTLCYIEKDGCYLMLHRVTKKNDINHDKWIGVGGHFEDNESPEECMRREVREETGLYIDQYRYCGIVTFQSDDDETEYMHLFLAEEFHGKLKSCEEGVLEWLPVSELTKIPHWVGDRIFLSLILYRKFPFFSLKLVYRDGVLLRSVLNEHNCLVTERLILRPWFEEDAAVLYQWASNPKIGLSAGWPPHRSEGDSRDVIREVLSRPECYAIVLRDTSEPVGCAGLTNFRLADQIESLISYFDERKSVHPACCSMPDLPEPEGGKEASAGKEKKDRIMSKKEKRIVAYHETGHALVSALQSNTEPVQKITIVPRTMGALGYVWQVPEEEKYLNSKVEMEEDIVTFLAGRAAEAIKFDSVTTGASNDIEQATNLARKMITIYGMSDKFGMVALESVQNRYLDGSLALNCSEETATKIDNEVRKVIKKSYDKAYKLLRDNVAVLDALAEYLIEKETITGKEFMKIYEEITGVSLKAAGEDEDRK